MTRYWKYDNMSLVKNAIQSNYQTVIEPPPYERITIPRNWGHIEIDRDGRQVVARFARFADNEIIDETRINKDFEFSSEEEAIEWMKSHRYSGNDIFGLTPDDWVVPVVNRDNAIDEFIRVNNMPYSLVRKRKGRSYSVDYNLAKHTCIYHTDHYHAAKITVSKYGTDTIVYTHEFGCDEIWSSLKAYLRIINNFDIALMTEAL